MLGYAFLRDQIAILGSGDVGKTLTSAFLSEGYEVAVGTRDPTSTKITQWLQSISNNTRVHAATHADAAAFGEIVVVAGPTDIKATEEIVRSANAAGGLNGKVVIDLVNPVKVDQQTGEVTLYRAHEDMWVAGNNTAAKQTASDIARQFGYVRVLDAGDIKASKLLEAVGCLWIVHAIKNKHFTHAWSFVELNQ
ncbi:hypothetical protein BC937DRAFT_93505 [Endogone sp. FLAS-F59071]|nr:hypothetical protein BC937DRAFT_93505 [Endogone sp. FLAS-F59071]|eukprot:RUS14651.1 hypothetical protein BC937DRAFT_93505 [Endogone sp. FLAS-F59071]